MKNPYLRLVRFDKPIGTLLLLWPTLWAIFIAGNGHPPIYIIIVFSLGVFLTRSAGCAINDYADAEFDKHVLRTMTRPLAFGEISKKQALIVCMLLSIAAFILALMTLKRATLLMSIPALVIFVTYPFMKRFFAIPQAYLGIAFSFGVLMAFIEIQEHLSSLAWMIFIANFFWVLGYDTIYALVDIEDDKKIGIKTSAITFGRYVFSIICVSYMIFITLLAYIAYLLNLGMFFWVLWLYAVYLLFYQIKFIQIPSRRLAMFLLNNRVGYVVFLAIVLGYWL